MRSILARTRFQPLHQVGRLVRIGLNKNGLRKSGLRKACLILSIVGLLVSGSSTFAQTLTEKLLSENPAKLAEQAREKGDIVRGAILFHQGNINCAKCHRTAQEAPLGPNLSDLGPEATDEYLIESILVPSKTIKKGFETILILMDDGRTLLGLKIGQTDKQISIRTVDEQNLQLDIPLDTIDEMRNSDVSSMPTGLADELKDRQQFLDLLRYVIDTRDRGPVADIKTESTATRRKLNDELHGLVLMQQRNCVACHQSEMFPSTLQAKQAPKLNWSASHLNPNYLMAFIESPHETKPGTTMPATLHYLNQATRTRTAKALTHYLVSKTGNDFNPTPIDEAAVKRGHELFNSVGCAACHAPRDRQGIEQPLPESTPMSRLIDKYDTRSLTQFLQDPLKVRASGHMPNMQLTFREAGDIANFLLQNQAESKFSSDWKVDEEIAKAGKNLFIQFDCFRCHQSVEPDLKKLGLVNLELLEKGNLEAGCLAAVSDATNKTLPKFRLSEKDRTAIQSAIGAAQQRQTEVAASQQIDLTLTQFNCIACHQRGDLGGVTVDRNPHFQTTNLNLGDQGRIPPTLSGVGAKLQPKWTRDVLVNRQSIRPYMKTRMPQFGEPNVGHLVELLEATDTLPESKFATFKDQKKTRETGHMLAGNRGLNCVACHTYQFKPSDTMPAVDLTEMSARLKKRWFYQYMLSPQTFSPNTVMPSFWPAGKAIRSDLSGTPEDQIEAIWQYLLDGRQARAPSGVVRKPLEIAVTGEAEMLRRSYPGIGKRGIGVGYPGGVNIAFDAEQMRLSSLWRGKFAEAGGVWRGQGSGTVRPMSRPINLQKGPELDDAKAPWVVDDGRPPRHRFQGYALDKQQRPTFRYAFGDVQIEDYFTEIQSDQPGQPALGLKRTLKFSSSQPVEALTFRVAGGEGIEKKQDGYLIGGQLTIRVVSQQKAVWNKDQTGGQVKLSLKLAADETQTLVIEYRWQP